MRVPPPPTKKLIPYSICADPPAVHDGEWEIPIPRKADGTFDYYIIQRAWWDAISATYKPQFWRGPLRMALEMRITGGSAVLMAPQRHNEATCSIEILTTANTKNSVW